jgi:hypothetical protein
VSRNFLSVFSSNNTSGSPDPWAKAVSNADSYSRWYSTYKIDFALCCLALSRYLLDNQQLSNLIYWQDPLQLFFLLDCRFNGFYKSRKNGVLTRYVAQRGVYTAHCRTAEFRLLVMPHSGESTTHYASQRSFDYSPCRTAVSRQLTMPHSGESTLLYAAQRGVNYSLFRTAGSRLWSMPQSAELRTCDSTLLEIRILN